MAVRHQLVRRPLHAPWKAPADESRYCERVAGTHSASADAGGRPRGEHTNGVLADA